MLAIVLADSIIYITMIAYTEASLSVGINEFEISEIETNGFHKTDLGDGELWVRRSPLVAGEKIDVSQVLDDFYLRKKIEAVGNIGIYAELIDRDVFINVDVEKLKDGNLTEITLDERQIFRGAFVGPNYTSIRLLATHHHMASHA